MKNKNQRPNTTVAAAASPATNKKQLHFTAQAMDFIDAQPATVQKEIFAVARRLSENGFLKEPEAKMIAPNLFEIRVRVSPNAYRLFYCYLGEDGVWLLSGFVKKVRKTPPHEIRKAKRIRKEVKDEIGGNG